MEWLIWFYVLGGLVFGLGLILAGIVGCLYLIVGMITRMTTRNRR